MTNGKCHKWNNEEMGCFTKGPAEATHSLDRIIISWIGERDVVDKCMYVRIFFKERKGRWKEDDS